MSYVYVGCAILLMVYCQLVIKLRVVSAGALPVGVPEKVRFLAGILLDPWIVSALAAALLFHEPLAARSRRGTAGG